MVSGSGKIFKNLGKSYSDWTHQLIKSDTFIMVSGGGKNSDCFQDHSNSRELGIWTGKLKVKRIILQQSNFASQQVELNRYKRKFECFGNLRDFYFFQDHMTSSYKWWGKTRIRTKNLKMGRPQLSLRQSPVLGMPTSPTETSAGTGKQGMPP